MSAARKGAPAAEAGSALDRRTVVARLLKDRGDLLVIAGLGAPAWDVAAAGDHPLSFPLWGAMGGAAMVGLGLALARPERRVLVVTGDGEMLMGLGALATIAVQRPDNLAIVVLDNERYGETGHAEDAHRLWRRPGRHGEGRGVCARTAYHDPARRRATRGPGSPWRGPACSRR